MENFINTIFNNIGRCYTKEVVDPNKNFYIIVGIMIVIFSIVLAGCSFSDDSNTITGDIKLFGGKGGGVPYNTTDFCITTTILIEGYCSGTTKTLQNITCSGNSSTTCSSGRCI